MAFEILTPRNIRRLIVFAIALAAGFAMTRFHPEGLSDAGRLTLGIFTTAALLWIIEPFPLYVTSFVIVILEGTPEALAPPGRAPPDGGGFPP